MTEPLKGRLLVATPILGDPNFDQTVVLVLEHGDDGAVGVVLNRPSDTGVGDALPGWHRLAADPPVVFVGGPVAPTAAICLGRARPGEEPEGFEALAETGLRGPNAVDSLGTVDLSLDADHFAATLQGIRVFVGYAGWASGQLELEIEAGAWFVVEARADDVLAPDPDALWQAVLKRQPGRLSLYANFPRDPAMN